MGKSKHDDALVPKCTKCAVFYLFYQMGMNRPPGSVGYDVGGYAQPFPGQPSSGQSKVPPCSTLFVANLHPDVQERDLNRVFRKYVFH